MTIKNLIPFLCAVCLAPGLRSATPVTTRRASEQIQLKLSPNTMKKRIHSACYDMSAPMKLNFDEAADIPSKPLESIQDASMFSEVKKVLLDQRTDDNSSCKFNAMNSPLLFAAIQQKNQPSQVQTTKESIVSKATNAIANAKHIITLDVGVSRKDILTNNYGEQVNILKPNTLVDCHPVISTKARLYWRAIFDNDFMFSLIHSQGVSHDITGLKQSIAMKDLSYCNIFSYSVLGLSYLPYSLAIFLEAYHLNSDLMHVMLGTAKRVELDVFGTLVKCTVVAGWQMQSCSAKKQSDRLCLNVLFGDDIKLASFEKVLN